MTPTVRPTICLTCESPLPVGRARVRYYCSPRCRQQRIQPNPAHDPIPKWQAPGVEPERVARLKAMSETELVAYCEAVLDRRHAVADAMLRLVA